MTNETKLCDCNRGNKVVECIDGICLCQECRNELTFSDGLTCVAWLERYHARRNAKYGEHFEPAQSSIEREQFGRQRENVWRPRK